MSTAPSSSSLYDGIIKQANDLLGMLDKKAFSPMPPDQAMQQQQAMPQQAPPAPQPGMAPAAPQQAQPGGQPMMPPQDPFTVLSQRVEEIEGALMEIMGGLEEQIMPVIEEMTEKGSAHDNALVEMNTALQRSQGDLEEIKQALMGGMTQQGDPRMPAQ